MGHGLAEPLTPLVMPFSFRAPMATYTNLSSAQAAYLANTDYADGAGDVTKAQTFRSACRALLVLLPQILSQSGVQRGMNMTNIKEELKAVDGWLASNNAATRPDGGRIAYADNEYFRDN